MKKKTNSSKASPAKPCSNRAERAKKRVGFADIAMLDKEQQRDFIEKEDKKPKNDMQKVPKKRPQKSKIFGSASPKAKADDYVEKKAKDTSSDVEKPILRTRRSRE